MLIWKRAAAALIVAAGTVSGIAAGTAPAAAETIAPETIVAAADSKARPGPGKTRDYICAVPVLEDLLSYCNDNPLTPQGLKVFRCISRNVVIDPSLPTSPTKIAKLAYIVPKCADDPTYGDDPSLLPFNNRLTT